MWGKSYSFPRAIVHVDGDSFFAAVEPAKDPRLKGKPVITGKERGIVSACTYEAKARGVKRGAKLGDRAFVLLRCGQPLCVQHWLGEWLRVPPARFYSRFYKSLGH